MSLLTIQGPSGPGVNPAKVSLRTHEVATFGLCKCGGCHLDLRLAATTPVQFRGLVVAGADRWRIENLSDSEPLVIEDVDGRAPATVALPMESLPFARDMAVVTPFGKVPGVSVTVFFSPSPGAVAAGQRCPAIESPRRELDQSARYFAVLSTLCEHVLKYGHAGQVPTSSAIAARLALSPRAVDSHIDYLVDKFDIPAPVTRNTGWKRRALIRYVRAHEGLAQVVRLGASAGTGQLVTGA